MRLFLTALLAGLFSPFHLFPQVQYPFPEGIFNTLSQYQPLHVIIETDFKELRSGKEDEQWQPAVFKVLQGDSVALKLDVQVAARGNMRKKNCDFPPVKIRFYDKEPEDDNIADINTLKLVTSCKDLPRNEEWVQREYLVYELYNIITEQSFRVKSASIRFEDTKKEGRYQESFSFFIESQKELATRLDGKIMKPRIGSIRSLDSVSYDRMCVFEYMIGNTDWSVHARHNIKLIFLAQTNMPVAIPYDFDYSAAVGTDYAAPNTDYYPIETVRDRYYLGSCRSEAHYRQIFDFYLSKEKELMARCEQAGYLPDHARKEMIKYFNNFFEVLKNPNSAMREIVNHCDKAR
ncbi:MAG TPA: hypothetical protein PK228_15330 [Saprospiraceae bacterium]|nr:hypothetical protein [Saprospiraceae bacterium]